MERLTRCWRRVLVALMPVALILVACTGATGVSNKAGVAAPQGEPAAGVNRDEREATPPSEPVEYLTINVDMTDDGFQPPSIFIPVGRSVQLVMRNLGTTEHHYRVVGLVPRDLKWLAGPGSVPQEGITDEEHHHATGFVPYRAASPTGIQPFGDEVHAYAVPGGIDAVLFVPTNTGTFLVQDPLHPEIVGKVTVFAPAGSPLRQSEEVRPLTPATLPARESGGVRTLTRELSRTTFLSEYEGASDIELEVLYATPTYFAMAVSEEGAARYAPEDFYVFLVSETVHDLALSDLPPPATLRVDGREIAPTDVNVLFGSVHHRTSVVRFAHGASETPRALELHIADAKPVRWELPTTYPENVHSESALSAESVPTRVPRLSWALLLPGLAGVLAALGPCLTQLVVYYLATLTGVGMEVLHDEVALATQRRRVLRTAIFFSLGFTTVYTTGGALAGMVGQSLQSLGALEIWNRPLSVAAGIVMLVLGWRVAVNARAPLVCQLPLASRLRSESGTGVWSSMMTGAAFAFGCLSCFGATVLVVLLLYIGSSGSVLMGTLIMFIFSLGVTVPFLLAALGLGQILPLLSRFERAMPWLGLAGGVVMMGFGVLMITYRFHDVSSFIYSFFS